MSLNLYSLNLVNGLFYESFGTSDGIYVKPSPTSGDVTGKVLTSDNSSGKVVWGDGPIIGLNNLDDVSTAGKVDGDALLYDEDLELWTPGKARGVPGGNATAVQYNSNNILTGSSFFTYNDTTRVLTVTNLLVNSIGIGTSTFSSGLITGLNNPINPTDATNKQYVDSLATNPPGGVDTSVQYNNATAFGGDAAFTYNSGTETLTVTKVTGLDNPVGVLDAVNKQYADTLIANLPGGVDTSVQFNAAGILGGDTFFVYNSGTETLSSTNIDVTDLTADTITTPIVTGLNNPVGVLDAVNKQYADTLIANLPGGVDTSIQFNDSGILGGNASFVYDKLTDTMTVSIIDGLATPTTNNQAANKEYVDNATGTSPGGTNQAVQFNNNGVFGGDNILTYDTGTDTLSSTNITVGSLTDGTTIMTTGNITNVSSLTSALVTTGKFITHKYQMIGVKSDFPTAVGGVITLEDNVTYLITDNIDLTGDRIVCGQNQYITGIGSETSSLTSTGLGISIALITSTYTCNIQSITMKDVGTLFDLDANGFADQVLDWILFNIVNVPTIGTINNYDNVIYNNSAIFSSANFRITGEIGTVACNNSIFIGLSGNSTFIIEATAVISRRVRFNLCSLIAFGTGVGITVENTASIPNEGLIISDCNFSGGSTTYIVGVTESNNISTFRSNIGIPNGRANGQVYFTNNAIVNTIAATNTYYKIAGTTTIDPISQRFSSPVTNRLTYIGISTQICEISWYVSLKGNNGVEFNVGVYSSASAGIIASSVNTRTTESQSKLVTMSGGCFLQMSTNDYIELHVANIQDTTNCTASRINIVVSTI